MTGNHKPEQARTPPVVSVVIPCCGQLEFTRLCATSLFQHSRAPFELVFVDLDSMDGTPEFLSGILTASNLPVQVLQLSGNAGFAEAWNRGISLARADYVVLLNNDTVVTGFWLEHLVALAESSPSIGVVGAMSNRADPPQSVGAVPYRLTTKTVVVAPDATNGTSRIDTEPIHRFAQQWAAQNRGQWFEVDQLSPFCLLFKREALSRVLPLEPDSFFTFNAGTAFRKLRDAGFQIVCCRDLFVHHFASRPSSS
jgi:GT2 family glycosyltransferase